MFIEAQAQAIWPFFATATGWTRYLSDITTTASNKDEFSLGEEVTIVIGELTNKAHCVALSKASFISFNESYASVLPNGSIWSYNLRTSFTLLQQEEMCKVTVRVEGYTADEMMQWVRECGEVGWRQSLFNLKNIIELGLDLRNDIFNYPRLGVLNYTATSSQLSSAGLEKSGPGGNYIKKVYPNSPAERAGLNDGIIITHIQHKPVATYYEFICALSSFYRKEAEVSIRYIFSGEWKETTVLLTYEDQFTGMVNPQLISQEELKEERLRLSGSQ
jgi:hypothetical protein